MAAGPLSAEVEGVEYLGDRWEVRANFRGLALVFLHDRALQPGAPVSLAVTSPRPRLEGSLPTRSLHACPS